MIILTKLNGDRILINPLQIEFVESIPESKIMMMNGKYHIVSESMEDVRQQFIDTLHSVHTGNGGEA